MNEYKIDCTGNCVTGDEIVFEKDVWKGYYPNAKWDGTESYAGKIIKDSYGKDKAQHTFTVLLLSGEKMLIKGRNLYKHSVYRKAWANEEERNKALSNKYERAKFAKTRTYINEFGNEVNR